MDGVRYAGWGWRLAAFWIDSGLAVAIGGLVELATGSYFLVSIAVAWVALTTGATAIFKGQSVGKRVVGLRVMFGERPATAGESLLRDTILRLPCLIPPVFIADSVWAAADEQRQSLRDKVIDTHVVLDGAGGARAVAAAVAALAVLGCLAGLVALDEEQPGGQRSAAETR